MTHQDPPDDLDRRRGDLERALAAKRPAQQNGNEAPKTSGLAGIGTALKLSSEFIAGIAVGAGVGWAIDKVAGTSPWGLIIFLFLGFGAGILNVLRSAGVAAEFGQKSPKDGGDGREKK